MGNSTQIERVSPKKNPASSGRVLLVNRSFFSLFYSLSRLQNFSNFLIGLPLTAYRRITLLFGFQGNWISCQVSRCSNVFVTKVKFLSLNKQFFHKRL